MLPFEETVVSLYQQGLPSREVGKRLHCSDTTVTRLLNKMGIKPRPQSTMKVSYDKIRKLREKGVSVIEIGKLFGIHRNTVYKIMSTPTLTKGQQILLDRGIEGLEQILKATQNYTNWHLTADDYHNLEVGRIRVRNELQSLKALKEAVS